MFWAQNLFWSRNFYGPKFWQDLKNSKQHFFHRLKFFGLKIFWSKNFSCNLYLFLVQNFLNKKSFWSANLFWTETKVLPNWSLTLKTKSCFTHIYYLTKMMHLAADICHILIWQQDLVFSVKLRFGKTLVSVQKKFALQKDFLFRKFWTKNKYKFQEKFWLKKCRVQKI